jgi:hypothetical protein
MKDFQFFSKDGSYIYCDINSPTYLDEKQQLIRQGFKQEAGVITAYSESDAAQRFNREQGNQMSESFLSSFFWDFFGDN